MVSTAPTRRGPRIALGTGASAAVIGGGGTFLVSSSPLLLLFVVVLAIGLLFVLAGVLFSGSDEPSKRLNRLLSVLLGRRQR